TASPPGPARGTRRTTSNRSCRDARAAFAGLRQVTGGAVTTWSLPRTPLGGVTSDRGRVIDG
ncbi:MAG TPA: hypothetical protein VNO31_50865, partial [Umezawaea sp.]|nr:hypothetical protein [Umezawaea sp.]